MIDKKEYLGDGLYVEYDGWHIKLSTPRENGEHYVGLDPFVMQALDKYRARLNEWRHQQKEIEDLE